MNRAIFLAFAITFVIAVLALATFVGNRDSSRSKFQIKTDSSTILFGVTPWGDARQMREAYRPILRYLSEKTGKKFHLLVMEDYDVSIDNLVEGNIDISVTSPVSYVIAKGREPALQYISTIIREHEGKYFATFKGYLVANKARYGGWTLDRFLKAPKKIRLGFVTKASASGWAYPMAMFKKMGVDPEKEFASVTIFDNHPQLTDAIAKDKVDIGATWEYNLENARGRYGDIFEIIYTTPDIPGLSWVASKRADPAFVSLIRQLQIEINGSDKLKKELLRATPDKGWMFLNDNFYDSVREVLRYVGEFR